MFVNSNDDPHTGAQNVAELLALASEAEWDEGMNWYLAANSFCEGLAKKYNLTTTQAAGVVAALSPQIEWGKNQAYAEALCRTNTVAGPYKANVDKARAILRNGNPEDVLGGNKVRAFFHCIANPTFSTAVVVDRHAWSVFKGEYHTIESMPDLRHRGRYERASEAYRIAANYFDIQPMQAQAIAWVVWRNRIDLMRASKGER